MNNDKTDAKFETTGSQIKNICNREPALEGSVGKLLVRGGRGEGG